MLTATFGASVPMYRNVSSSSCSPSVARIAPLSLPLLRFAPHTLQTLRRSARNTSNNLMRHASRRVYKGTAPRIGRPVTVREGTFWCCVARIYPEGREFESRRAHESGRHFLCRPGAHIMWFRSPGTRARRPARGSGPGSSAYRPGMARADRVPLSRVTGRVTESVRGQKPYYTLREAPPEAGSTREVPGTCGGDRERSLMGQSDGGDEDATLSKGGSDDAARVPTGI